MTLVKPYIVDADSHWSEPADLFTKRAPAHLKDRVPHHEDDRRPTHVGHGRRADRHGRLRRGDRRDGKKAPSEIGLQEWHVEDAHKGAYDPEVRACRSSTTSASTPR